MSTLGTVLAGRPSPLTWLPELTGERRRTLVVGFTIAAFLATLRVGWNLAYDNDLFLDSWVLVHVLDVLGGGAERMPRATLTLEYPLSYLPTLPVAMLLGPADTVKYVYPVVASLAAVPAYAMLRHGPAPVLGVFALLLLPDLAVKGLTGTPQGMALPLFVLASYFALAENRVGFLLTAAAILFTHHLTGMVTLVVYYTVVAMPRSREPGWLQREAPYLLFFACWPAYWAWTFFQTDQSYIWPIFLTLATVAGGTSAVLLYAFLPQIQRVAEYTGAIARRIPPHLVIEGAILIGLAGWLLSTRTLDSPGLSSAALANRAVVAIYAGLLFICALAVLARGHMGLLLLFGTLGWLGFLVLPTGCHRVFDGLRLADYAILGGLVGLMAPGLDARWKSPAVVLAIALVFSAAALRMEYGRDRLFGLTDGQYAAAQWVEANTEPGVSIATDTKMSLLILGEANRSATFEGSRWLFDGTPIGPTITALNTSGPSFLNHPITHVMLTDYMLTRGADVGWFGATTVVKPGMYEELDAIGERVYVQDGVTIWALDQERTTGDGRREFASKSALTLLTDRFFGSLPIVGRGGVCD
jgi:hypothetical protein